MRWAQQALNGQGIPSGASDVLVESKARANINARLEGSLLFLHIERGFENIYDSLRQTRKRRDLCRL